VVQLCCIPVTLITSRILRQYHSHRMRKNNHWNWACHSYTRMIEISKLDCFKWPRATTAPLNRLLSRRINRGGDLVRIAEWKRARELKENTLLNGENNNYIHEQVTADNTTRQCCVFYIRAQPENLPRGCRYELTQRRSRYKARNANDKRRVSYTRGGRYTLSYLLLISLLTDY
jgi:hypothetical protein